MLVNAITQLGLYKKDDINYIFSRDKEIHNYFC